MAHARNVRLIGESRRKDDPFDTRALAPMSTEVVRLSAHPKIDLPDFCRNEAPEQNV